MDNGHGHLRKKRDDFNTNIFVVNKVENCYNEM